MLAQLAKLRAAAEESQRKEAAAKAVLEAAKTASREGRTLSAGDRASAERPILNPEQAKTGSASQVQVYGSSVSSATTVGWAVTSPADSLYASKG